jgi:hypothetical protein
VHTIEHVGDHHPDVVDGDHLTPRLRVDSDAENSHAVHKLGMLGHAPATPYFGLRAS